MSNEVSLDDIGYSGEVHMPVSFDIPSPLRSSLGSDFNEYGVRENSDGSVDVRFSAMEPGVRNGVEITPEFLNSVFSEEFSTKRPVQLNHSHDQLDNVGWIAPDKATYDSNTDWVNLGVHVPNTGSSLRDDVIADFTHDPPAISDGSIGFYPGSLVAEESSADGAVVRFTDAEFMEFSLTPFPAGYGDEGGVTAAFSTEFADDGQPGRSQLSVRKQHYTVRKY